MPVTRRKKRKDKEFVVLKGKKYDPHTTPVDVYDMARNGFTNKQICKVLKISKDTLIDWRANRPVIAYALKKAREKDDKGNSADTIIKYMYNSLSPPMQRLWDKIHRYSKSVYREQRIESLFQKKPLHVRQQLFLHAYVVSSFNLSAACRKVCISKKTFDNWLKNDDFKKLCDEIRWHKQNFVESSMFKLIKKGDVTATIHANKALNADRGYGDNKKTVEIKGSVDHTHSFDRIMERLPTAEKKQILLMLEKAQEQETIQDAEIVERV